MIYKIEAAIRGKPYNKAYAAYNYRDSSWMWDIIDKHIQVNQDESIVLFLKQEFA